ncbi:MAG: CDP-archaeol synthase [Desulfobacteraceae bacterium]|nr:CDP-archaeol synthase [Desulfobacteraceae bacterium]
MMLFSKLLLLLWAANFAPPFTAVIFEGKWERPLDGNRLLSDGKPLFGSHKTIRGIAAGIVIGAIMAPLLGFPVWLGFLAAVLSMAGDLASSFVKRRLSLHSGRVVPGLDQLPEGLLPFLLFAPYFSLSWDFIIPFGLAFSAGAYYGSVFLKDVLLRRPSAEYPRKVRAATRFRELISCSITTKPFNYLLNFEDAFIYHFFMKSFFKIFRLYDRGMMNALRIEKREVVFEFPDLPPAFDGYRILFLTDLHLDGLDGLADRAVEIVRRTPADLCIFGGDFRMETHGSFEKALAQLRIILPEIKSPDGCYGVMGNHDCLEILAPLHDAICFLINDHAFIEKNGQRLWLVGTDDCHYFKSQDPDKAFKDVPSSAFTIFVSHSNEIYLKARKHGPRLFLCGHTHAGQIKIPPFGPVFTHSRAPRYMCEGRWDYEGMAGYTSAGLGVSGVPVRFNSTGEVTVITLKKS